jgi:uncharacterized coiled-coil DUF342 family protein
MKADEAMLEKLRELRRRAEDTKWQMGVAETLEELKKELREIHLNTALILEKLQEVSV